MTAARVLIVGGGPAGSLLAIFLARRGLAPRVVERASAAESRAASGGRSINLALAARGMAALGRAGVLADVEELLIPMRGRMLHEPEQPPRLLPYGQRPGEEIYSVARGALNARLQDVARERFGVDYRYECRCTGVEPSTGFPIVESAAGRETLEADAVLGADGAGSAVRRSLAAHGAVDAREELLRHGYVELAMPAAAGGAYALDPHALHIWPRGGFMLIALPNPGGSFTATLFLPLEGETSFAAFGDAGLRGLFEREFPDALPLVPELDDPGRRRPIGTLGTVHCRPWSFRDRLLLLGDAAHAIVPFHGQGMNAAFEDCAEIDALIGAHGERWDVVLAEFEARRRPNTEAIAQMAIENYREMRDSVREPAFALRRRVAFELERRFPERFIPRYSMVMFHPEIPYAEALRRGEIQAEILATLTASARTLDEVDFELAARLVSARL